MIPLFPEFKKLELEDREDIENITKKFPPYSDFHFTSLWSYNTEELAEISILNGNLVLKFTDYMTNEVFLTFIGENLLKDTIVTLLDFAQKHHLMQKLGLIPEHCIKTHPELYNEFIIEEDRDNYDYILNTDELSELKGNKYRAKRNFVNRYKKFYMSHSVSKIDLTNQSIQNQIIDLFLLWEKQNKKTREDTETELIAIKRLLKVAYKWDLYSIGLFDGQKMIAFSINELAHDQHSVIHFEKADTSYIGIYQYLKQLTARHLKELGSAYINYEQDLGIEGLRKAKESWVPTHYLKKYTIRKK
jgi:hypothetical protein